MSNKRYIVSSCTSLLQHNVDTVMHKVQYNNQLCTSKRIAGQAERTKKTFERQKRKKGIVTG